MSEIFMKASKLKLRFETSKGDLTVEDLWGLPLTATRANTLNLDDLGMDLLAKIETSNGKKSLVRPAAKMGAAVLQLKFDIVKFIIDTLVAERDRKEKRAALATEQQRLMDLINSKETEAEKALPLAELKTKLAASLAATEEEQD
jgi:hypothetical protein